MFFWIILVFGIVVLITHFLEGITGFGCTVLALPFCIKLLDMQYGQNNGIQIAVPVLMVLGFLLCLYVVIISYKDIVWKEYLRIICFVGLGLPVGILLFKELPKQVLIYILGAFMIFISLRGLYTCIKRVEQKQLNTHILNLVLFLGGCIHGAFSSGGPLVIIYAARKLQNKNQFRATLCMMWVTMNAILIGQKTVDGVFTPDVLKIVGICIPFLAVGAILGNKAHHKLKPDVFLRIVYGVLLLSGIMMFM